MLVTILLILVAIIAIILLIAATKPRSFRVERTTTIEAPPARIFGLINDLREWPRWSPWERLDPNMSRTYSGSDSGVGAAYAWSGNKKAGSGRMEIIESVPPQRVTLDLYFQEPFEARNTSEFTIDGADSGSRVKWAVFGPMTFMTRVMCVFVSMDRLMGKDFEEGLRNMKREAEATTVVSGS